MVWSWEEASRVQGGYFTFHELVSPNWVTYFTSPVCVGAGQDVHIMWLQVITSTQGMTAMVSSNGNHNFQYYNPSYVYIYNCLYSRGVRMNESACFADRWVWWIRIVCVCQCISVSTKLDTKRDGWHNRIIWMCAGCVCLWYLCYQSVSAYIKCSYVSSSENNPVQSCMPCYIATHYSTPLQMCPHLLLLCCLYVT